VGFLKSIKSINESFEKTFKDIQTFEEMELKFYALIGDIELGKVIQNEMLEGQESLKENFESCCGEISSILFESYLEHQLQILRKQMYKALHYF